MTQLIGRTTNGTAPVVISETALGKGGEGSVYTVTSHDLTDLPAASTLVAKIYHAPDAPHPGDRAFYDGQVLHEQPAGGRVQTVQNSEIST